LGLIPPTDPRTFDERINPDPDLFFDLLRGVFGGLSWLKEGLTDAVLPSSEVYYDEQGNLHNYGPTSGQLGAPGTMLLPGFKKGGRKGGLKGNCAEKGKRPVKPQQPGVRVHPRNPASAPISQATPPGKYVFVQDANGVVYVVPDGPHLHPTVLGGGQPAAAAGEVVIGPNGVVTEINNISFTFQHGGEVLPGVQSALEGAGLSVAPDAIKPFNF
jgi:hypothetical protein